MAKKKVTEEPIVDVQEVYTKTELFVDRNRKGLTIVLGILVVLFAGYSAYKYLVVNPAEEEAQNSIWKAQQYFEMDSVEQARFGDGYYAGFEEIIESQEGTKAAQLAHYYLGILDRNDAEYETAIEHFKACNFNDNAIGLIAMGNIGDLYIELEDYEEGAAWLEKTAKRAKTSSSEEFSAPFYLYKAGIAYMEVENYGKAKEMFSDIDKNYEGSSEHDKASKFVGRLSQY